VNFRAVAEAGAEITLELLNVLRAEHRTTPASFG